MLKVLKPFLEKKGLFHSLKINNNNCCEPKKKNSILNFEDMNEGFGKAEKLKSSVVIKDLFVKGKSINKYPIKLVYLPVSHTGFTTHKAAVSVPKRNFRKAVERNYLKRLMREAFRKNKYLVTSNLNCSYAFMFIYTGKEKEPYQKILSATEELLKKLIKREK